MLVPNPAPSTMKFIRDMILSNEITSSQLADAADLPSTLRAHPYMKHHPLLVGEDIDIDLFLARINRE
ncbi:hypothetical protein IFM61606_07171 [Aspergillus udagawae]|uniref:Uncharacterized protein n=1 Tax=Aspergillus udagawae TaxID=91492 RepID=A0ABQ1AX18_9EURO|nr:hypothetical protein IFM53868_05808 [Aspergillus udagawae]GFG27153.1 hypothetical protein IFM61606_07171 [Aspergillus udagawae]